MVLTRDELVARLTRAGELASGLLNSGIQNTRPPTAHFAPPGPNFPKGASSVPVRSAENFYLNIALARERSSRCGAKSTIDVKAAPASGSFATAAFSAAFTLSRPAASGVR